MDTTKNKMNPIKPINPMTPDMLQEENKESKVPKGVIGAGIGVAAAGLGAAAGATVNSALNDEKYDLSGDDENVVDPNEENPYYDDDKDTPISPEDKRPEDPDDEKKEQTPNEEDPEIKIPGGNNKEVEDPDAPGNIDDGADRLIEEDLVDVNEVPGEWTAVGWKTITDENGNEVEAMIFSDGNGGYVALIEGEPGSGIFDVAMNPDTGEMIQIQEQYAFTRGDFDSIIEDDGGYLAPGAEDDRLFADNDDIDKDIIVTDDGKLVAERDIDDDFDNGDGYDGTDDHAETIIEDDKIDDAIEGDDMAEVDDIIEDDDIIIDGVIEGDDMADIDDEDLISDDELDGYLGDDEYAEVNEDTVETIDDSDEMLADDTLIMDDMEDSIDMEPDNFDDGIDMA